MCEKRFETNGWNSKPNRHICHFFVPFIFLVLLQNLIFYDIFDTKHQYFSQISASGRSIADMKQIVGSMGKPMKKKKLLVFIALQITVFYRGLPHFAFEGMILGNFVFFLGFFLLLFCFVLLIIYDQNHSCVKFLIFSMSAR